MFRSFLPGKFMTRIFLALLLSGLIQVLLLGGIAILFSNKMIEDSLTHQSSGRMELLVSRLNLSLQEYRELGNRLVKEPLFETALFDPVYPDKTFLSTMYQTLYREIAGNLETLSIHLVDTGGDRKFSTHILPDIYNPGSVNESLSTYRKLKGESRSLTVVDGFLNPKGERVGFSVITSLQGGPDQDGLIIIDVNVQQLLELTEKINADFFSDLYLIDHTTHKYVNLFRENEAGNFSGIDWRVQPGMNGSLKNNDTLIVFETLYPADLMLVGTLKLSTAAGNFLPLIRLIFIVSLGGLFISSLFSFSLARMITRPVNTLVEGMKKVESGDLSISLDEKNGDEFDILINGFNDMVSQMQTLVQARIEKEKAIREAERQALQAQINPHFLNNTLNTVKSLAKLHGVKDIAVIITQLGKLLRNAMDGQRELVTIEESLALVEGYLQIQKIRYGSNFSWEIHMDPECRTMLVPHLLIQPIVENAVIHGTDQLIGPRRISVLIRKDPFLVKVTDNGPGIDPEVWEHSLSSRNAIGLYNVNQRIRIYFEGDSGLCYGRENNHSVVVLNLGKLRKEYYHV